MNTQTLDKLPETVYLLEIALKYLEHPDVDALPFALPVSSVASRIRQCLREIEGIQDLA